MFQEGEIRIVPLRFWKVGLHLVLSLAFECSKSDGLARSAGLIVYSMLHYEWVQSSQSRVFVKGGPWEKYIVHATGEAIIVAEWFPGVSAG